METFKKESPRFYGISKRRNRSVVEVARVMLLEKNISKTFFREAVSTRVYTMNRV